MHAKSIVIATDVKVARNLLQDIDIDGLGQILKILPELPQRSSGCIYYGFISPAPLAEPILILNGGGSERPNTKEFPTNNVSFPSIVQPKGYAPNGYELCCVSILENELSGHTGEQCWKQNRIRPS